jgi:hypothetical protein
VWRVLERDLGYMRKDGVGAHHSLRMDLNKESVCYPQLVSNSLSDSRDAMQERFNQRHLWQSLGTQRLGTAVVSLIGIQNLGSRGKFSDHGEGLVGYVARIRTARLCGSVAKPDGR